MNPKKTPNVEHVGGSLSSWVAFATQTLHDLTSSLGHCIFGRSPGEELPAPAPPAPAPEPLREAIKMLLEAPGFGDGTSCWGWKNRWRRGSSSTRCRAPIGKVLGIEAAVPYPAASWMVSSARKPGTCSMPWDHQRWRSPVVMILWRSSACFRFMSGGAESHGSFEPWGRLLWGRAFLPGWNVVLKIGTSCTLPFLFFTLEDFDDRIFARHGWRPRCCPSCEAAGQQLGSSVTTQFFTCHLAQIILWPWDVHPFAMGLKDIKGTTGRISGAWCSCP